MKLRRKIGLAMLLPLMAWASPGFADSIWKCVDAEGHVLFTSTRDPNMKCKVLIQDKPQATQAAPKPRQASAAASPTPQDFPKVNGDTQRGRDQTRRQILERELTEEQSQLEKAKLAEQSVGGDERQRKSLQDRVAEHQRNIQALRLEMSKLK